MSRFTSKSPFVKPVQMNTHEINVNSADRLLTKVSVFDLEVRVL